MQMSVQALPSELRIVTCQETSPIIVGSETQPFLLLPPPFPQPPSLLYHFFIYQVHCSGWIPPAGQMFPGIWDFMLRLEKCNQGAETFSKTIASKQTHVS